MKERLYLIAIALLLAFNVSGQTNELRQQFSNPSSDYGPWVFWMWMNGNITKEGITLDLEAMHRVGISGAVLFTSNAGLPQGKVEYAGSEWMDMNKHMFAEAKRLGMKVMLHNGPGYSVTGGPWITPENSMQQVVWSETFVKGDKEIQSIKLPKPYAKKGYYEDALVVAFPSLKGEDKPMQKLLERITVNNQEENKELLYNNDYDTSIEINIPQGKKEGELFLEFNEPFEASSIMIRREHTEPPHHPYDGLRDNPPTIALEYSEDGITYKQLLSFGMPELRELNVPASRNFNTVKVKYYRLLSNKDTKLTEVILYATPRLPDWEYKANYNVKGNRKTDLTVKNIPTEYIINPDKVIDLTTLLSSDGTVNWNAPDGNWTILRIGHTTTGEENAAAPWGAMGLECDKLGKRGMQAHYDGFLKRLFEEMKSFAGESFYGITVDSWEAGTQNWTKGFEHEFYRRHQYRIAPYIAAFTGRIVGGNVTTERFLEDIRNTQGTMLAENYHKELRDLCHKHNLCFLNESYGDGPFSSLEVGKYVDIPTGEFWAHGIYGGSHTNNQAGYLARTNGRKIVGAEAYTARPELSKFTEYPAEMKNMGDWMFTNGINRLMYHTYAHQPHPTVKPGMTMGPFGTHFNRNQTWWEQLDTYIDYVTRCQFMLQHGEFISNSSPWIPFGEETDPTQQRPDFTYTATNANAVVNYIHRRLDQTDYYFVCNGKRSGESILASFNVTGKQPEIWCPETGMQYPVYNYKKEKGKTIIPLDMKPAESMFIVFNDLSKVAPSWPSIKEELENQASEPVLYKDIYNSFSTSAWLRPDVDAIPARSYVIYPQSGEELYGKGHATIGLAVGQNGVRVFEQAGNRAEQVLFVETKIEGWSLVNVVYDNGKPLVYLNGKKIAEGTKSAYTIHPNANELAPVDPILILFQGEYTTPEIEKNILSAKEITAMYHSGKPVAPLPAYAENIIKINTPWTISFPEDTSAAGQVTEKKLKSLHLYKDKEVKYFSGTATYTTSINLPTSYAGGGKKIMIDLGNVAFFAEISINGNRLPVLWKPPYVCDVTAFIHDGNNSIEVKVTNLWTNRLIGDEFLPVENSYDKWGELDKFPDWYVNDQPYNGKRNTFVAWKQYDKHGPLTESGLMGPVRIYVAK
ncbi:MAG: glycosyl hydrolase [Bacteroidales bacterium]